MKKMKKVLTVMLSLCMMFTALCFTKLDAEAAEPVTYTLRVINGDWRMQPNYPWVDGGFHRELYYLYQDLKDGDKLVVDDASKKLEITLEKRLNNITIAKSCEAVIYTPGVDNVYVLDGNVAAINGDVTNGYVYGAAKVNFNNNVDYLEINGNSFPFSADVRVLGTVNHYRGQEPHKVWHDYYSFVPGTFYMQAGTIRTEVANYSTVAPVVATPAPVTKPSTSAGDELDDVPKTGDFATYYWMFGLAAACLVMGMGLKFLSGKEEN